MTACLRDPRSDRLSLLGVYLNDHLAGATLGTELARRMAKAERHAATAQELRRLAAEIAEDRASLLDIMRALGVRPRRYKAGAGWLAEKAGRLKGNRQLVRRSPLSSLLELEMLRIGVEGKALGWRALREVADGHERLDKRRLDGLLDRARDQGATLERLHLQRVAHALPAS
ncbi:hypothetical protein ACFOSC_14375 [Streptantibioticus rubrisoli]|uniref:Uncharacterized protein n=1 Tax=Streptantibioticus rubrisoli TaxID=1387313 RepID=A0ABT1P9W3_9ACTN|nr:hypothetical protein [Streptantibioticus rubrisoli]MCQ4042167.1 hypothetical protein [Streptantibioticus rubrisoli]